MIIVVEGPSASGKTTWGQAHAPDVVVAESAPADPPEDASAAARFWAENGARRWEQAIATEQRVGIAVCDTDPLKLHYSWSLWRIGAGSRQVFQRQVDAYRELMDGRRIGFADAYFVSIPDPEVLELRRTGDPKRRRRNFALHARLGEPLREWYAALEEVRPGSVRWGFPDEGVGQPVHSVRPRYDLEAYDALIGLAFTRPAGL
ncbi:MAG: hypothetical protein DLM71_04060 [Chloroflexi bacterium]|nr:MAG: hypothetical protein DLM71_04060 [Chloroflexota bacterium]